MIMNLFGFVQSVKRFGLLVQFIRLESNVGNVPVSPFPPPPPPQNIPNTNRQYLLVPQQSSGTGRE